MFKALCLAFVLAVPTAIQAQTVTAKDLDARIENQLYEVIKLGTDIYNRGGYDACYRLYQGSLMSLVGFLEHRPEHIAKIKKAFKDADNTTNVSERAHVLREVMDDLRAAIKATHTTTTATAKEPLTTKPITPTTPPTLTLWKRLGGEESLKPIINHWIDRALLNPRINFTRRGTGQEWEANPENVNKIKRQFLALLSAKTGGPLQYAGKDMKTTHANMKISEAEFNVFMEEFRMSLEKFFVSPFDRGELINAMLETKKDIVDTTVVIKPLWDRLGGEANVTLVVDDFLARAIKNPAINFGRKGLPKTWAGTPVQVAVLSKQIIQYVSSITGGPQKYTGKSMKEAHAGMQITEAEFNALLVELKVSLDVYNVNAADREELLLALQKIKADFVTK